ncbi:restriction endonuclease subunit S [Vibrio cholerae]|nr:restriction endonuclease subunit S [Vibrio cholerae]
MTGRYKAYPEYKDSGLRWLPELPSNWKVERTKRMFALKRSLVGNQSSDYQLLSLTLKGVVPRDISSGEGKIPESFDTYQKVDENDLIFCLFDMDETPRTIGISPLNGMITGAYNVYGCLESCCANYAYYYFLHIDSFKGLKPFYTGLRKVVRAETFGNIEMPCPSFEEQQKIASFLDHETAKIDTLIAKQEKLIELLKEKRQAVISHAVTKGLNPDAPMKDSGVEWLGEVPEHWEVTPLKHLCRFSGGGTPTKDNLSYWKNGTIPWVSPKDMKSLRVTQTCDYITEKAVVESSTNYVDSGALLMVVRSGILQRTIPVAINDVVVTLNQDMKALKFNNKMAVDFALYFIVGNEKALLLEWSKEGATVESIEHEYLANGLLSVPPLSEQLFIVQYLSAEMEKFSQLETKASLGIELLKERKTALISAAVTGKIDVRHFVAEQGQPQGVQG